MLRAEIRQQQIFMFLFSDKNVQVPGMGNSLEQNHSG